jgi:hypothetical protein
MREPLHTISLDLSVLRSILTKFNPSNGSFKRWHTSARFTGGNDQRHSDKLTWVMRHIHQDPITAHRRSARGLVSSGRVKALHSFQGAVCERLAKQDKSRSRLVGMDVSQNELLLIHTAMEYVVYPESNFQNVSFSCECNNFLDCRKITH